MSLYVPNRGDLVLIDFNPQAGHEQAGRRPALILSPKEYNSKVGLAILCPITSKKKGYPFEVPIPNGLSIQGVILSDQIKNMDWKSRKADYVSRIPNDVLKAVLIKLYTLL
jgi:mRNA interferase MazF